MATECTTSGEDHAMLAEAVAGVPLSSRRRWHLNYSSRFPDPLPRKFGHQPAVTQDRIPFDLLVTDPEHDRLREAELLTSAEIRQNKRDLAWAFKREQTIAAAAAGVHLLNFATHWLNSQFRYLDHAYAPRHQNIFTQFGKW